jgi:REP element-mobilizing transposase RayT
LREKYREKLYRYIGGIIRNNKCVLYKINGVEDHLHIATHLHPSVALSNLVKDVKVASSIWIKDNELFPGFVGWQNGYGAFTYSISDKEKVVNYINNQQDHHTKRSFKEEYIGFLKEHNIVFEEKYLF